MKSGGYRPRFISQVLTTQQNAAMNMDKDKQKEATTIQVKRRILSDLSKDAEILRKKLIREYNEKGQSNKALFYDGCTVNYLLLHHIYDTDGASEFKTFMQWKTEGATIKKGAKAFIIWGQPLGSRPEDKEEIEDQEYMYFPLCYLFSDKQVSKPIDRVKEIEKSENIEEVELITDDIF